MSAMCRPGRERAPGWRPGLLAQRAEPRLLRGPFSLEGRRLGGLWASPLPLRRSLADPGMRGAAGGPSSIGSSPTSGSRPRPGPISSAAILGGHAVLFADAADAWAGHLEAVVRLAGLAEVIEPARRPKRRSGGESIAAQVGALATWLADGALVKAYEIVGERERAVSIMERRVGSSGRPMTG